MSEQTAQAVLNALEAIANPDRATHAQRFFRTGPGDYGEGDRFLGIRVPQTRQIAKEFRDLTLTEARRLLHSPWHEARLCALLILVDQFRRGGEGERRRIFELYRDNVDKVNNWDLVDSSAPQILGAYLLERDRGFLLEWARSGDLWRRRCAMLATFAFIRRGEFSDTFVIADTLLPDPRDLIHKAVGWMLREVGNRDRSALERFLDERCHVMPRVMLRYAIEKFPEPLRQDYLTGKRSRARK